MNTLTTSSSASTKALGQRMAERILAVIPVKTGIQSKKSKTEGAFIIALSGDLGAGKTTFVQGFARGLGIKKRATSPTFIIFRRFAIPKVESHKSKVESLYHVDAYRIKKSADLTALGFKEILKDPKNIVLIEWPENIKKILPKTVFWVRFKHGRRELERSLTFSKDLL